MRIKRLLLMAALALSAMAITLPANAQINVFTDHQAIYMVQHGVNQDADVQFVTGKYPYVGRIGLEYERRNWAYTISYIHRSNIDMTHGDEYNYNGLSLGIKYRHCIAYCN